MNRPRDEPTVLNRPVMKRPVMNRPATSTSVSDGKVSYYSHKPCSTHPSDKIDPINYFLAFVIEQSFHAGANSRKMQPYSRRIMHEVRREKRRYFYRHPTAGRRLYISVLQNTTLIFNLIFMCTKL